ncbi:unnamed protein product [Ectocarpus fasciculatus]
MRFGVLAERTTDAKLLRRGTDAHQCGGRREKTGIPCEIWTIGREGRTGGSALSKPRSRATPGLAFEPCVWRERICGQRKRLATGRGRGKWGLGPAQAGVGFGTRVGLAATAARTSPAPFRLFCFLSVVFQLPTNEVVCGPRAPPSRLIARIGGARPPVALAASYGEQPAIATSPAHVLAICPRLSAGLSQPYRVYDQGEIKMDARVFTVRLLVVQRPPSRSWRVPILDRIHHAVTS